MNEAADFKSAVSTYFTIQAERGDWRRGPESNRASRICNPVHNRFVTAPHSQQSKAMLAIFKKSNKKGQHFEVLPFELEREKSLELSTSTLARLRSTN